MTHTPGPWTLLPNIGILAPNGREIARTIVPEAIPVMVAVTEAHDNAAYIVTACNNYPGLLAALEGAYLRAHPCPECGQVEVLGDTPEDIVARCPCSIEGGVSWTWQDVAPVAAGWREARAIIAKCKEGG